MIYLSKGGLMKIKLKYRVMGVPNSDGTADHRVYLIWRLPDALEVDHIKSVELWAEVDRKRRRINVQDYVGIAESNPFTRRVWLYCLPLMPSTREYYIRVNITKSKLHPDMQGTRLHIPSELYTSNSVTVDPNNYPLDGKESED